MDGVTREQYRDIIKGNLANVVHSTFIPEFGFPFQGKVRDIYDLGETLLMLTSDRISAFDIVHERRIPFKGAVLNGLSLFGFRLSEDIMASALISAPDPYAQIQEKLENLGFECVVRGYVWGSLADAYEKGVREICGIKLPEGLLRYQKLAEPLFTPTTKAPKGYHDEPVTLEQMINGFQANYGLVKGLADKYGKDKAAEMGSHVRDTSIRLYKRAQEHALSQGLIFIDTKYEFGIGKDGRIRLIDEANTSDSSRMVDKAEHDEKWVEIDRIIKILRTGTLGERTVSELLKGRPDLKITELTKEYVRDKLREIGYKHGDAKLPDLSDEIVIETALRYIETYERFTGQIFDFVRSELSGARRLMNNLIKAGLAQGYCAVIVAGSDSDAHHIDKIVNSLKEYNMPFQVRIKSAHKQDIPALVQFYDTQSLEPLAWISVAGGTDALSGITSWHSIYPTISCPPNGITNTSCLTNPPGSANSTIIKPANVAKHLAQMWSHINPKLAERMKELNDAKVRDLEDADELARTGRFNELLSKTKK